MKKRFNSRLKVNSAAGFTLIELLVSLAIIALVTGLFMANYSGGEDKTNLLNVRDNLIKNLYLVQNNATGLVKYNGYSWRDTGSGALNNWGLKIDKTNNQYIIFADLNGSFTYGGPVDEANDKYGGQIIHLPSSIVIDSLTSNYISTATANSSATIFPAPLDCPGCQTTVINDEDTGCSDPNLCCNNGQSICPNLTVILKDLNTNATTSVNINSVGLFAQP